MAYHKVNEVVGWSYNGALYCVDHEPEPVDLSIEEVMAAVSPPPIDVPQPVFLDQVTSHDVCDLCFIPLDA